MCTTRSKGRVLRMKLISAAVSSCFASAAVFANPTGGVPVAGTVTVTSSPGVLSVTNSPNSIINWNTFSIGVGELTRFMQQSAASAVLNRVVTSSPSDILGTLQSNGRVFLINPNGIVFGGTAMVDVAGLVASTLNLTDADFLSGGMRFQEVPGAGTVDNQGSIFAAPGGQVYLVGPAVTNGGLINSPRGEVILAAGNSVELMNTGTPGLSVSITAPDNQALNMGQILAASGRVGILAGVINQGGTVAANAAVLGADGSIKLKATDATTFAAGSLTTTSGPLEIETGDLSVAGEVRSGPQAINATGTVVVRNEQPEGIALLFATGGQTINARALEVTGQHGGLATIANLFTGDQTITITGGGTSPGIDVRSMPSGGAATIANNTPGAAQTIVVTDADHINVNGAGDSGRFFNGAFIAAIGATQTLSITGSGANAINIGSAAAQSRSILNGTSQHIIAGQGNEAGSITIIGSDGNGRFAGLSSQPAGTAGTQTVSTTGTLSIIGGNAPAQAPTNPPAIFHNTVGPQTISADRIVLLGGSSGSGNSTRINVNNGSQLVTARSIEMTGGAGGTSNTALLRATGPQTIVADELTITAGAGGTGNFSVIVAPLQDVTVRGNLTLSGGGSVPTAITGGGALIGGGNGFPTNLALTVGGDVTLNGGSAPVAGSALGGGSSGGQRTDIVVNVTGNVTLNPGDATGTRIGSPPENIAGGEIFVTAGGTIALNSAGAGNAGVIRTADGVTLRARSITQGADARIQANALALQTQGDAILVGDNDVNFLSGANFGFGDLSFNNSSPLLVLTDLQNLAGGLTLQQTGDLHVRGRVRTGPQAINVTGGLVVQNEPFSGVSLDANGGQTLQARFVEVNAVEGGGAGIANVGGTQSISTFGANAVDEGLAVRGLGGFAQVLSFEGDQHIDIRNADRAVIDGLQLNAPVINIGGVQTFSVTGAGANALVLGGPSSLAQSVIGGGGFQTVIAGNPGEQGSITIYGTATGGPTNTFIVSNPIPSGTQTVSTSGVLSVFGGSAMAGTAAGIFANGIDGRQAVSAGSIVLQSGSTGSGNSAMIGANNGSQTITVGAGGITLRGGAAGGSNFAMINQLSTNLAYTQTVQSTGPVLLEGGAGNFNFAMIRAFGGHQGLTLGDTTLLAGAGGIDNFAVIQGRSQDMTVHGDLALVARGSAGSPTIGGGARIGGVGGAAPSTTSLRLNVDGDFTMTGGSVAGTGTLLGNTPNFAGNTDINVNVGGDVALNGGTAPNTFSTIGSRASNVAGGEIAISALGNIALNSSAPDAAAIIRTTDGVTLRAQQITQGPDARIEAGSLAVETARGATLGGANSVSQLAMLNSASGDVAFNNTSALLTVTGIEQVPAGALSLSQAGNLRINGDVTSGAQNISASGDMTVTPGAGPNVTVQAHGAQTFNVGGSFSLLGGTAWNGYAQALAQGPVSISTGGDLNVRGGSGLLAYALLYGSDDIRLTIGDELRIDGGSGLLAFARVQADLWDKIFLDFPNRASGGYFVNGREGVTHRGLDGFFTGPLPARLGRSLIVSYGE